MYSKQSVSNLWIDFLKSYTWSSTSETQYNQNQDNKGLKRRIKRNNFLIKIPNAHLILRLHLLHLLNCFWWWWWCWWVQLILFFIFSPPLQVDGCHLYAHLTPHHNLIRVTHIYTQLFLFISSWYQTSNSWIPFVDPHCFLSLQYLFIVFVSSTLYYNTLRRIN